MLEQLGVGCRGSESKALLLLPTRLHRRRFILLSPLLQNVSHFHHDGHRSEWPTTAGFYGIYKIIRKVGQRP